MSDRTSPKARIRARVLAILAAQALAVALFTSGALGSAPSAPPNCTSAAQTFTNNTVTPIPDVSTVNSVLNVAGVGPYLLDVDVTTNITHTFNTDLDIFLTSPAGTVVTLSTDNGGANDNVFNGTLWDDDGDPSGTVPYVTNDGLATDHAYANLTVASPLVPEEALGAFVGENANGTWTLTITDDNGTDTGSLNQWQLSLTTLSSAPTPAGPTTFVNNTVTPIPENPGATATSTIAAAGLATYLLDVNVTTNITHTDSSDLDFTVTSPGGSVITLSTDNGGGLDNIFAGTTWDDDAGTAVSDFTHANAVTSTPLVPEEAMAAAIGENPNGNWTLTIDDDLAPDTGNLNSWQVHITTGACSAPPPPPSGGCDVNGTSGNDIVTGTGADETICTKGGNDTARGKGGDDVLKLGPGNDLGKGGGGNDQIRCDGGRNDKGVGGAGNDTRSGCERGRS